MSSVGLVGLEPTTNGLKERGSCGEENTPTSDGDHTSARSARGRSVDDLSGLARAVLSLAGMGAPVPEVLADGLARAVLQQPPALLAQDVLKGGSHKLLRTIELAEIVLGAAQQDRPEIQRTGHQKDIRMGSGQGF